MQYLLWHGACKIDKQKTLKLQYLKGIIIWLEKL